MQPNSHSASGSAVPPQPAVAATPRQDAKKFETTWVLALFLGGWGVDRFYLGKVGTGILKLVTGGGLGVWWLIDVILVLSGKATTKSGQPLADPPANKTGLIVASVVVVVLALPILLFIPLVFLHGVQSTAGY